MAAARAQAERLAFVHNERLTNPAQEQLARELVEVAPEGFTRARFVTSGSTPTRWRSSSPAATTSNAASRALAGDLARAGVPRTDDGDAGAHGAAGLHGPFGPYLAKHLHIPPSTSRFDPTGEAALAALDQALEEAGPETVSAFFCEAISAAALPALLAATAFWEGLAERREQHGFLVCFDEVVTGVGGPVMVRRRRRRRARPTSSRRPRGSAPATRRSARSCAATRCSKRSRGLAAVPARPHWDGAPLSCAVGLAVLDALRRRG